MTGRMQQETHRGPQSGPQNTMVTSDTNERNGDGRSNGSGDESHPIADRYNFHDASFRRHYQLNYHDGPHAYEYYAPAYRFGYTLAEENVGLQWAEAEEQAQRHWQDNHATAWDEMTEAIHYGWREQRNPDALRVHHHGDYDDFRKSFHTHYREALQDAGAPFEHYEPAYRYGYELAIDPAYNSRLWTEVEPEVRAYYKTEYADGRLPWEHYRAAVSRAWDDVHTTA